MILSALVLLGTLALYYMPDLGTRAMGLIYKLIG
jgi:hypothetical protein